MVTLIYEYPKVPGAYAILDILLQGENKTWLKKFNHDLFSKKKKNYTSVQNAWGIIINL